MKCGICSRRLTTEAEEYDNGRADWWICRKCHVMRKLEPFDKPETAAEQEQWDTLFKGKKFPQRLSETDNPAFSALKTALSGSHKQQERD